MHHGFTRGAAAAVALSVTFMAGVASAGAASTTTTTLASSVNPSNVNQATTLTASVVVPIGNAGAACTGTVAFKNGASTLTCTGGNQNITSVNPTTFTATCPVSFPTAGPQSLTAVYNPTSGCLTSTSTALIQTVNAAAAVPTLGGWAAYVFTGLLLAGGLGVMARRHKTPPFTAA